MPKRRYVIDGEQWVPVAAAARLIGTNALGVRKLISEGALRSRQSRLGSRIIVVDLESILRLRAEREQWRKERRPRMPKAAKSAAQTALPPHPQRLPGHREQLALPMTDSGRGRPSVRRT